MAVYQDVDLYGRDNTDGTPITYYSANAIKNALTQWANSKRGDYLMVPGAGGALDNFAFKTLTSENILILKTQLLTALVNQFSPSITVIDISITPDYQNRITEIEVTYSIQEEKVTDSVSLFINTAFSTASFEYETVNYIEQNLLEFVTIKKPDQMANRLIYDHEINSWKWGKFKFISLTPSDPYFTDILIVCNGS
jgi:hypothetical protein